MTEILYGIASKLYHVVRPTRDPAYLRFIRQFPCVGCCTVRRRREAMHTGPHGMGQKAGDEDCLPGCRQCHQELHQTGPRKFQARRKIEFAVLIAMFQALYRAQFPDRKPPSSATESKIEGVDAA